MLLVVDIGNTNIVLGVYDGDKLLDSWRISTDRDKTADEYGMVIKSLLHDGGISHTSIGAVAISCVVPTVISEIERMCKRYFRAEPLIVGPGVKTGLKIKIENPREVGADRIVNAIAALEKYGGPVIVVDLGTATTFDAVSEQGEYLGGVIAPGIGISTEALVTRASKLPRVAIVKPDQVVGRNTIRSMQSGIFYGFLGQVNEIIRRMQSELGWDAKVLATGGLSELICRESEEIDEVCPDLTLEGLRLIYERNI